MAGEKQAAAAKEQADSGGNDMWGALIAAGSMLAGKIIDAATKEDAPEPRNMTFYNPGLRDHLRRRLSDPAFSYKLPEIQTPAAPTTPFPLAPRNNWYR